MIRARRETGMERQSPAPHLIEFLTALRRDLALDNVLLLTDAFAMYHIIAFIWRTNGNRMR